jgi:hypothetical protein
VPLTVPISDRNLTSRAPDDHLVALLGMKRHLSKKIGVFALAADCAEITGF